MIRGLFILDRPHVRVLFRFAELRGLGAVECYALLDTGTDVTIVMPRDYLRAGLPPDAFAESPTTSATGIGGSSEFRHVRAIATLAGDDGRFYRYESLLNVAPPVRAFQEFPTLMGRDISDHCRLIVDPTNNFIALDDPENYR